MEIREITFDEIYPVWQHYLWPDRISVVEPYSMILFNTLPYEYSNDCLKRKITFFGAFTDRCLAGVNSGHLICNTYRSRGLYVFEPFRGLGIGAALLRATIRQSYAENAEFCWSMPRQTSIKSYLNAGFNVVGDWFDTETSKNIYVSNSR